MLHATLRGSGSGRDRARPTVSAAQAAHTQFSVCRSQFDFLLIPLSIWLLHGLAILLLVHGGGGVVVH